MLVCNRENHAAAIWNHYLGCHLEIVRNLWLIASIKALRDSSFVILKIHVVQKYWAIDEQLAHLAKPHSGPIIIRHQEIILQKNSEKL
jgi:hypothetical protein